MVNKKVIFLVASILIMLNIHVVHAENTESEVGVYFEEIVPDSKIPNVEGEKPTSPNAGTGKPSISFDKTGKLPQTSEIKQQSTSVLGMLAVSPALVLLYRKKNRLRGE